MTKSRGCKDKYINKEAQLTTQLLMEQQIKHLDHLRSQLYIHLNSPFKLLYDVDNDDGYILGDYVIWQEDMQAEIFGYQNWQISLKLLIDIYTKKLDELQRLKYNNSNITQIVLNIKPKPGQLSFDFYSLN